MNKIIFHFFFKNPKEYQGSSAKAVTSKFCFGYIKFKKKNTLRLKSSLIKEASPKLILTLSKQI
jgi:hypothetical protein